MANKMDDQIQAGMHERDQLYTEIDRLKKENEFLKEQFEELQHELILQHTQKDNLKFAIKKGIIRSVDDDGSLTIYWNDLTDNEQDLLTEILNDK